MCEEPRTVLIVNISAHQQAGEEIHLLPEQSQRLAALMSYSDTYWRYHTLWCLQLFALIASLCVLPREVWALAALNPACLESRTVTALFFTPPGKEPDVDPVIALNTYHALSVGTDHSHVYSVNDSAHPDEW